MAEMTPMMRQYMEIKEQNKDSILFFRLGDFYEMFGDDAQKASRELDLTLTTRDKDKNKSFEEKTPMCGMPVPRLRRLHRPAHRQGLQGGYLRADGGSRRRQGAGGAGHRPHRDAGYRHRLRHAWRRGAATICAGIYLDGD